MVNAGAEDDDGFIGYVPSTIDPGYALLIAAIIFSLLSSAVLPCLVTLGRKYEKRRMAEQQREEQDVAATTTTATSAFQPTTNGMEVRIENRSISGAGDQYKPDSYVRPEGKQNHGAAWSRLLDQVVLPPYADDHGSTLGGGAASAILGSTSSAIGSSTSDAADETPLVNDSNMNILDAGCGTKKNLRSVQRTRRAQNDHDAMRKVQKAERQADKKQFGNLTFDDEEVKGLTISRSASPVQHLGSESDAFRGARRLGGGTISAISGVSSIRKGRDTSPPPSVLSRLDDHVISPNDAADANDPGIYNLPKAEMEGEELDICCGKRAWWKPSVILGGIDRLVELAEYDNEMRRILKLCIPYSITALLEGLEEVVLTALVGQFIGTQAMIAFAIVQLVIGVVMETLGGILASMATLCPHAIGAGNYKLAGQYAQVATFLFSVLMVPNVFIWSFWMDDVIILFGFDEETARIGQDYAFVVVFVEWINGIIYAYNALLNVNGYERYAGSVEVSASVVTMGATALVLFFRETTLQEMGLLHLAIGLLFLLGNCWYTISKGWMNQFLEGMIGSLALFNGKIVKNVSNLAIPLALGYLFEHGEWEILTIFVAHLGPAEVAAWAIIGNLWDTFETLSEGIADGGEVRCAYHLGNGNPGMAQISAYKTILVGVAAGGFFTSILFMMGDNVAVWLTTDPTLQHMIAQLIPMLGVGNIALTAGTVSWALVGAQGRYRLATFIALLSSWGVTMPLAALMVYGFNFDLQGVTVAVVVGYSVTNTGLNYVLLRSDWDRISRHVVEINKEMDDDSSEDESDPAVLRAQAMQENDGTASATPPVTADLEAR